MVDHGEIQDFPSPEIEPYLVERAHKTFHVAALTAEDFAEKRPRGIIGMVDGEITTVDAGYSDRIDVEYDVLKIAVVERHKNTHHIGIGYIQGYGLKSGAVATSISHDSHNIIVVGTNETDMAAAVNRVVELNGGIVVWDGGQSVAEVPLAIAGIMSDEPLVTVNEKLETAKEMGADVVFNSGKCDLVEEVKKLTDGVGVDAAIDITGAGPAINASLRSVRAAGKLVCVGLPTKNVEMDMANDLIYREVEVTGVSGRKIWETWTDFAKVMKGPYYNLDKVMGNRFALKDFEQAIAQIESGIPGKMILYP